MPPGANVLTGRGGRWRAGSGVGRVGNNRFGGGVAIIVD